MRIPSYLQFINEAFNASQMDKVATLVQKYLGKKTNFHFTRMPGTEEFVNSQGHGFGIRFFFNGNQSIRFNWKTDKLSATCDSIDIWDAHSQSSNPQFRVDVNGLPLVQVLPSLGDILRDPKVGKYEVLKTGTNEAEGDNLYNEALTEAMREETYSKFLAHLTAMINLGTPMSVNNMIAGAPGAPQEQRAAAAVIFTNLVHADKVQMVKANTFQLVSGHQVTVDELQKMHVATQISVDNGPTKDTVKPTAQAVQVEQDADRLCFEAQLEDLVTVTSMVINGAAYSMFVAGRGGVGKTHNVEQTLHDHGLKDGDGYFKMTGSASASGIYRTLYDNRKGIVLFDDCDSALNDQEARNLIKNATDTKKIRKIGWGKRVSWVYDPALEPDREDDGENYPSYFNFEGKVIFISNLNLQKLDPDGALRTRSFVVNIDPSDLEVMEFMAKIIDKVPLEEGLVLTHDERMEALEALKQQKGEINIRKLCRALNMRASGVQDWHRIVVRYA